MKDSKSLGLFEEINVLWELTQYFCFRKFDSILGSVNFKCQKSTFIKIRLFYTYTATIIQGRKLLINRTFWVRQLFKGDNYSREETIRGNTVFFFNFIHDLPFSPGHLLESEVMFVNLSCNFSPLCGVACLIIKSNSNLLLKFRFSQKTTKI